MKPVFFAILAGLCWGVGEVFAKSVLHTREIGPFATVAVRTTVALPLLWIAYYYVAHVLRSPMETTDWVTGMSGLTWAKLVLGAGVVAGAAAVIFFYISLSLGEVSVMKPVAFALAPATGVVLGAWVLGEPLGARKIAAVVLIIAGVLLMISKPRPAPAPPDGAPTADAP